MSLAHALHTHPLEDINCLATPLTGMHATMHTPALDVLTDYVRYRPHVVENTLSVTRCEELMRKSHIRFMLVVDPQNRLLGMVDMVDLVGPRLQKLVGPDQPKREILVQEVMTPRSELKSIDYDDLRRATVGDLVETLTHDHCQLILVVDRGREEIRGIVTANDLAQCLDVPLDITYAPTFADICHVTKEHLAANQT